MTEIENKIVKEKTISSQFLEDKIPRLREVVTKFLCGKIASVINSDGKKDFSWQEIKTCSDVVVLIDKITELIEQNKSLDVDLTNNDDILSDEISFTDERLKEIQNYILPDLKEYIQYSKPNTKKKIKKKKIENS